MLHFHNRKWKVNFSKFWPRWPNVAKWQGKASKYRSTFFAIRLLVAGAKGLNICVSELEPVRQSGSGPAGPDKTGRKVHPAGRNRIFAGFFSIFCRISAGFLSVWRQKWTGRILPDFFRFFCRISAGLTSKMIRPDFDRTGPDAKIRPVPTLKQRESSKPVEFVDFYNTFF